MCKWLRSLLRLGERKTEKPENHQEHGQEPQGDARPAAGCRPVQASLPPRNEPVLVRGRAWYNTTAPESSGPREQEPAGAPSVESLVAKLLHDTRFENRIAAAEALGQMGPAGGDAILPLLQSLAVDNSGVRQAALSALQAIDADWRRHLAIQEVVPLWAKALSRGSLEVNSYLTRQLCAIGAPAVPGLAQAMAEAGDVAANVFVLRALVQMGPNAAQALPEMIRSLGSEYSHTRIAAAEALERIGPTAVAAIPALRASLTHWNPEVRRAAADCLAHLGPAAQPTAPAARQAPLSTGSQARRQAPMALAGVLARLSQPGSVGYMSERASACEQALAMVNREAEPLLWAGLQNELAKSLAQSTCGDPARNTDLAIQHFEQALEVYTRQAHPEQWAMVQSNLSACYRKRTSGDRAENVELAISCCQKALEVRTRQADPEGWATAHNNLANAYRDRVEGDRAENIEQAVHHCEQALEALSPQLHPWKWATAQNNLANAYQDRVHGERAENLEQAIHHYKEALKVFTREAFPADWAWTHSNLGAAYRARVRGDRADNLEQAIRHSQQALEVYTRQSTPEEWAATHYNLANAYQDRVLGDHDDNLVKAVRHHGQALEVFTRGAYPERWAADQEQLAGAEEESRPGVERLRDLSVRQPPTLSYPQFYEGESRQQPGERLRLELVFCKSPDSAFEHSLVLVYEWDAEIPEEEAQRLGLRAVAYVSCAVYDAAKSAGLPCRASPIPNGRRPAWLIGSEPVPISLTLSDVDVSDRTCQMSIGPIVVRLGAQPANGPLLAQLAEGFRAGFSTITV